jgi:hypothetical protein
MKHEKFLPPLSSIHVCVDTCLTILGQAKREYELRKLYGKRPELHTTRDRDGQLPDDFLGEK